MFTKQVREKVGDAYSRSGTVYRTKTVTDWDAVGGAIVIVIVVLAVLGALAK